MSRAVDHLILVEVEQKRAVGLVVDAPAAVCLILADHLAHVLFHQVALGHVLAGEGAPAVDGGPPDEDAPPLAVLQARLRRGGGVEEVGGVDGGKEGQGVAR